jgi:hypothetical protein
MSDWRSEFTKTKDPEEDKKKEEKNQIPVWKLLKVGSFFDYVCWDIQTHEGINERRYDVSSKSEDLVRFIISESSGKKNTLTINNKGYVIDKEEDLSLSPEYAKTFKDRTKTDLWIDPTKTDIGTIIETEIVIEKLPDLSHVLKVKSIETVNNRECFYARFYKTYSIKIPNPPFYESYYDLQTGLLIRGFTQNKVNDELIGITRDLFSTNLSGFENYHGPKFVINPQRSREITRKEERHVATLKRMLKNY